MLLLGIILTATIMIMQQLNVSLALAFPVTNKMRYSTNAAPMESYSLEQMLELSASKSTSLSPVKNNYRINRDSNKAERHFADHHLLDEEDKSLLAKFYRETKERDPFLSINGGSLSTEALWNESLLDEDANRLNALIDFEPSKKPAQPQAPLDPAAGWAFDFDEAQLNLKPSDNQSEDQLNQHMPTSSALLQANYSPTLRLLTSYDPVDEAAILSPTGDKTAEIQSAAPLRDNRIVGATLYTTAKDRPPGVSSKSALEAIKLHDDLLKEPPRDGKTRVRMYYHRAIHDDKRLYGNGPWKYWGHGWGLEFGFDPKSEGSDNYYQKGYTIERAFGRDFCRDKSNCRKADPEFFDDPKNVGSYSRQIMQQKSSHPI